MSLVSKSMVYRVLSDKIYLLSGLRSPLRVLQIKLYEDFVLNFSIFISAQPAPVLGNAGLCNFFLHFSIDLSSNRSRARQR